MPKETKELNRLKKSLLKIEKRQFVLNKEASNLHQTTKARRIRINILLDLLSNQEEKTLKKISEIKIS